MRTHEQPAIRRVWEVLSASSGMIRVGLFLSVTSLSSQVARAQDAMGKPPEEAKAVVEAPKEADAPKIEKPSEATNVSLSAGGQLSTGNSRLLAATANGIAETRWDNNGVGGGILANYGRSGPPGMAVATTAENLQGRLRYDRYLIDQASVFALNTVRHDRFQGIDLRYNLDPGFKYIPLNEAATSLWAEAGYDLQYDVRRESARTVMGQAALLPKTATDHSLRTFVGFKHAFNEQVTFSTGLEFLQSFVHGDHNRLNYDALFAAKVAGGLALGIGFTARYDHTPLPGKKHLDTATTLSLIYAYSDAVPPPAPPVCPPPEPVAPPPSADAAPVAAPAPAPPEPVAPDAVTEPDASTPSAPADAPATPESPSVPLP